VTLRIRFDLAYDGTGFSGWARQPERRTVEGVFSQALATVLRAEGPVRLTVAGRTDAGVHARGQVAHADVDEAAWFRLPGRSDRPAPDAAVRRLAGVLPQDLVVRRATPAPDGFDARFSALSRRYRYRLLDDPTAADPLRRHDTVLHGDRLDVDAMDRAARELVGLHDFAAFCKQREGATTTRTLLEYRWVRGTDGVLEATVVADAFCHNMVRALVGAVVRVGEARESVGWPAEVLASRRRDPRVTVMAPHGLCLEEVRYPPDDELAARAEQARAVRVLES
jgi:tRNA pseudouridine38-40 synthase